MPELKGFETQVLMEGSDTFDAEHLNYFSPSSMKLCLESLGLEVLKLFTPGEIDVDIVKSKIEKGFEVKEDKFIQYLTSRTDKETLNNFQRFLQKIIFQLTCGLQQKKLIYSSFKNFK